LIARIASNTAIDFLRRSGRVSFSDLDDLPEPVVSSPADSPEQLLLRAEHRYQLEGALQSAHVFRRRTGRENWKEVLQLYDALLAVSGSPVVAINRALAVAEISGADAGLEAMQAVSSDPRLTEYQPYWAARAELLAKRGSTDEARDAYEIAIGLERDAAVRRFLQHRQSILPEDFPA
jgi:RNA polymerase sigma-70 factor (ECF subfamily)